MASDHSHHHGVLTTHFAPADDNHPYAWFGKRADCECGHLTPILGLAENALTEHHAHRAAMGAPHDPEAIAA